MVSSPVTGEKISHPDTARVINYLSQFVDVNFEFFDFLMSPSQRDSILKHKPVTEIIVTDRNGKSNQVKLYPIPVNPFSIAKTDTSGEPAKYDVDRMYAFTHNDSDLVGLQVFVFGKFFKSLSDFNAAAVRKQR